MTIDGCSYKISTQFTEPCEPCNYKRITVRKVRKYKGAFLYINYHYLIKQCFVGMTDGPFLNAFTLLPNEELELEVIRRSKYSTSYHEERSHSSTISHEITNTIRQEVEKRFEVNLSIDTNAGIDIGILEGGVDTSLDTEFEIASNLFRESVVQASYNASNSFEMTIDYKTEVEHSHRQLRKVHNPNKCRAVTYFYYQLMKKYITSLILERITYDIRPNLLSFFDKKSDTYSYSLRKSEIISSELNLIPKTFSADEKSEYPIAYKKISGIKLDFKRPDIVAKELNENQLISELRRSNLGKPLESDILEAIDQIKNNPHVSVGEEIWKTETCIKTNSTVVDVKVSDCDICPTEHVVPNTEDQS